MRTIGRHFATYFAIYVAMVFVFDTDLDHVIKLVKLFSLCQMIVLAPGIIRDLATRDIHLPGRVHGWLDAVRVVAFAAAFGVFASMMPSDRVSEWTGSPVRFSFISDMIRYFHEVVRDVYIANIAALLPIFMFFATNIVGATETATDTRLRPHFVSLVYFVDVPCVIAVTAFFMIAVSVIPFSHPTSGEIGAFLGGATALLLFMSNAMTICVNTAALHRLDDGNTAQVITKDGVNSDDD